MADFGQQLADFRQLIRTDNKFGMKSRHFVLDTGWARIGLPPRCDPWLPKSPHLGSHPRIDQFGTRLIGVADMAVLLCRSDLEATPLH